MQLSVSLSDILIDIKALSYLPLTFTERDFSYSRCTWRTQCSAVSLQGLALLTTFVDEPWTYGMNAYFATSCATEISVVEPLGSQHWFRWRQPTWKYWNKTELALLFFFFFFLQRYIYSIYSICTTISTVVFNRK